MRVFLFFLAVAAAAAEPAGEIAGRIRVTSSLTKKRITVPQIYDRTSAIAATSVPKADLEAELRRVVVYLDTKALPAKPLQAVIDQRQRRFDPEVVAVPVGSTISFPNSDPIFHNVFSLSKAKPLDLGNYKAGETRSVTFPNAGVVQLHCHLHPNMNGTVLVTPNNFFTQPGSQGEFSLPNVPPGRYTLVAWHKSAGFFHRTVDVRAGQPLRVDFEIPLKDVAP